MSKANKVGNNLSTSIQENTPMSKNKPGKQKRDAAKRRMSKVQEIEGNMEQEREEESCK